MEIDKNFERQWSDLVELIIVIYQCKRTTSLCSNKHNLVSFSVRLSLPLVNLMKQ